MNKYLYILIGTASLSTTSLADPLHRDLVEHDSPFASRTITSRAPIAIELRFDDGGYGRFHSNITLTVPKNKRMAEALDGLKNNGMQTYFGYSTTSNVFKKNKKVKRAEEHGSFSLRIRDFRGGTTIAVEGGISHFRNLPSNISSKMIVSATLGLDSSLFQTKCNLPPAFNWDTFLKLNPTLKPPLGLSPQKQKGWAEEQFLRTFPQSGMSWIVGLPVRFSWQRFLAQNPRLEERYTREQARKGIAPSHPSFLFDRATWLQRVALLSMQGKEGGYAWKPGLPVNFNWKGFLAQNPGLADRYTSEQRRLGRTLDTTPNFLGHRADWLQQIALLSIQGKEGGYCWIENLLPGFNWRKALTLPVKMRYRTEQLRKTEKATGDTSNPAEYLTAKDFAADGTLTPRDPLWLGKQALWVQLIKRKGEI